MNRLNLFNRMGNKKEEFYPFPIEQEADVVSEYKGITVKIYFMENYEKRAEADMKQLTYIDRDETSFSIMLEKVLYDKVPELYSAESLVAQHEYYATKSTMNMPLMLGGGFAIIVISTMIMNLWIEIFYAAAFGLFFGVVYMLFIMTRALRRDLELASLKLRDDMTAIHGEAKLDELVAKQEEYARSHGLGAE